MAAERRTLASAATLKGFEVTQHVLLGDAPLFQRTGEVLAEFEEELAAHRHREPLRVGNRIEDTGRPAPAGDEHCVALPGELREAASKLARRGRLHLFPLFSGWPGASGVSMAAWEPSDLRFRD